MMPRFLSRRTVATLSAALVVAPLIVAAGLSAAHDPDREPSNLSAAYQEEVARAEAMRCPEDLLVKGTLPGQPDSCAHVDIAPPGVDVNKPVSTAVLETREGASAAAVDAAQDEGVPTAAEVALVTDRVPCDGDGTSGYRTQAIYAVTADKANRYGDLQDQIKQWATGMNTVFNQSAAKTGGVRDLRFVSAPNGDGTCSPTVLNITLPVGAGASFGATINAMQNLGYTSGARKYSIWFDGTGQCGIAQTYLSSTPGQNNPNNGGYPQFARTDTPCWGSSQSVEAHELSHTMGSVQGDAPHATTNGHCYDESDRMCYADGGGKAMQQICSGDQEVLFDCNNDDYYSTFPQAGSYLATHWNTADSRFLIGGGDGNGGGGAGVPTRLGGTLTINNPAVPGLMTQVAMDLEVPAGRTTATKWTTTRKDCVFADPNATQTTVTCDAKLITPAPLTATVTDNTGDKVTRTGLVTFTTSPRAAQPVLSLDTFTGSTYTMCPTGKTVLSAQITDQASGAPVKGVTVTWLRTVGAATPATVVTAITNISGVAVAPARVLTAGGYTAKTTTAGAFGSATSARTDVSVATGTCTTGLTSGTNTASVLAGSPVTVSGALSRTVPAGTPAPAAGEAVQVYSQSPTTGLWTVAATATTGADGSYSAILKPVVSTALQVRFKARTGWQAATGSTLPVTVVPWTTGLTANVSATTTSAGTPVTVTGSLTQSDGEASTAMAAQKVTITYPVAGNKTATGAASTNTAGTYTLVVKPTGSGTITVSYAGKPGWPARTATASMSVTALTTSLTASTSAATVMAGNAFTISGVLTQTAGSSTTGLASSPVQVTYPTATGTTTTTTTTKAGGAYSLVIRPVRTGEVVVRYAGKPGWEGTSTNRPMVVNNWTSSLAMSATRNPSTGVVAVTGTLSVTDNTGTTTPKASGLVTLTYQLTATKTATVKVMTNTTGKFTTSVKPGASGTVSAQYAGATGWGGATADPVTITVP